MKIAVIDDDPISQFLTSALLARLSTVHQIIAFHDGKHALEFFAENMADISLLPGLLILDINMPVMNGWQFLDSLQKLYIVDYKPAIYIQTSSTDSSDLQQSKTYPQLQGLLIKPLLQNDLIDVLASTELFLRNQTNNRC